MSLIMWEKLTARMMAKAVALVAAVAGEAGEALAVVAAEVSDTG